MLMQQLILIIWVLSIIPLVTFNAHECCNGTLTGRLKKDQT